MVSEEDFYVNIAPVRGDELDSLQTRPSDWSKYLQ
jgi:hypothetical protein